MRPVDLDAIVEVARALDQLGASYALTGGSIIGFLVDNPSLIAIRPTDDVDAIVSVVTRIQYTGLEEQIRGLGFAHDTSDGAPACRWIYRDIKVDILPAKDPTGQFSDDWFEYALSKAGERSLDHITVRTVSPACFIATKLTAFRDRGGGDYYHHDIEDIVTVIDGRKNFVDELTAEDHALKRYVSGTIRDLLVDEAFRDALPGHLESDEASQGRLPLLLERLNAIAALVQQ